MSGIAFVLLVSVLLFSAPHGHAQLSAKPLETHHPDCTELDAGLTLKLAVTIDTFNKAAGLLENLSGRSLAQDIKIPLAFLPAVLKDLDASRPSGVALSPMASHTLEQVGRFGLKALPTLVDQLKTEGRLPERFNVLPSTFGIPDLIAGGASQFGSRRLGVEQITLYLDGIAKATAATAGYLAGQSGGPVVAARMARLAESGADLAIVTLRGVTMPLFQEAYNAPVRRQMISNWETMQESRMARGLPLQRLSEMHTPSELKQVGFTTEAIAQMNRLADWANAARSNVAVPLARFDLINPYGSQQNVRQSLGLTSGGQGGICLGGNQSYRVDPQLDNEIDQAERDASD